MPRLRGCLRSSPVAGEPSRLPFFCADFLHHLELEITLGDELFEPCVLLIKLSKPSYIEFLELPEPLAPEVYRLLRDAVLLRGLRDRPRIGFPQDPNHLLFRKPCLLHRFLLPGESHLPKNQSVRKSPGRSGQVKYRCEKDDRCTEMGLQLVSGLTFNLLGA